MPGMTKPPAQYHPTSTSPACPTPRVYSVGWVLMQCLVEMPEDIPLGITIWLCSPSHTIHI